MVFNGYIYIILLNNLLKMEIYDFSRPTPLSAQWATENFFTGSPTELYTTLTQGKISEHLSQPFWYFFFHRLSLKMCRALNDPAALNYYNCRVTARLSAMTYYARASLCSARGIPTKRARSSRGTLRSLAR